MRKIYTSIELGSYSIKIVVCEMIGNNPHVLASSNTRCKGIKNGVIIDPTLVKEYLLAGLKKIEDVLGFRINEAVIGISSDEVNFDILQSDDIKIESENGLVTDADIEKIYSEITIGNIGEGEELLSIMPISFQVDKGELTKDPKGMEGSMLSLKAVVIKIPSANLKVFLDLFQECEIKVVDITLSALGDYYEIRNKEFDHGVSAIINIGYDKTEVSVYNKGIMIKYENIPEGSMLIDKDLVYMYKIKKGQARKLKECFAVSNTRYSDVNDITEITNKEGNLIRINQLEISEIVENRIVYLLKIAKKQINLLTNREISNIIITGGISELAGFQYVVENVFDNKTSTLDIKDMGIRNNMYSSCFGLIKYFNNKLDFRGITYSMVNDDDIKNLGEQKGKNIGSKDGILNKVFGHFRDE